MRKRIFIAFLPLLLYSCNSIINTAYDDTTARYNAYFLANESIEKIENDLLESTLENYDSLIELTYTIDTNKISGLKEKKDDIIKKLSILIQRHPGSKYVFPSYALIGKARLLSLDLNQSITTLKYVNSKSDNELAKQMALIFLMRAYTEKEDYASAQEVLNFLRKNTIAKNLKIEYHLNTHYLFKKQNKIDLILNELYELEKIVKKRNLLNKIYFGIGQIQILNKDYESAQIYFKKCLTNNPSFAMEFTAKIFYARTLVNVDETETSKYFLKLIKDKKNTENLFRIYYEIAKLSESKMKFEDAIKNYNTSIRNNKKNKNLLFYSYKNIADIYYSNINNFKSAKLYYDSALNNINREFKGYNSLKEKSDVLTELVENLEIINNNDSLINLTLIPEIELNEILEQTLKLNSEKKKKEKVRNSQQNFLQDNPKIIIASNSDGQWYFDNESMKSIGKNDFQRIWGNRELKDNWRIMSKISFSNEYEESIVIQNNIDEGSEVNKDEEKNILNLKSSLPFEQSDKDKLIKEIEKAYYNIGKIYIQKLNEQEQGIETYMEFIERFKSSEYLAEIYYQLYLISEDREKYKNLILNNYSETDYYKLIINPNYQIDEFQELNLLKRIYNDLYENLKAGNNFYVINKVDSLKLKYEKNPFYENILLLQLIGRGKEAGNFSLQFELKRFLKNAVGKSAISYASTLLKSAEEVHKSFIFSGIPNFKNNLDTNYYFFIFSSEEFRQIFNDRLRNLLNKVNLPESIYEFELREGVNFDIVYLESKENLQILESEFNSSLSIEESNGNTNFVVGEKNMNLIFRSKNYIEFKKFYKK